ncbi:lactadherin-like [Branchiostoma floridae x Branchiostoma japonicum]
MAIFRVIFGFIVFLCILGLFPVAESDVCSLKLGMENGTIEDGDITASSYYRYWPPWAARLDGDNACWRPSESNGSWIQVDLKDNKTVSGVITQGYDGFFDFNDYWITGYEVYYLSTSGSLEPIKDQSGNVITFSGNTDLNGHKTNMFDRPVVTQVIRLYPTSWQRGPGLRMELLGCDFIGQKSRWFVVNP